MNVNMRMTEWEELIARTHKAGMKVIMDFVPNHVAREYHSIRKPAGVRDLGEDDDKNMHFSTKNNFYYTWGDLDLNDVRHSKPEFKLMPTRMLPSMSHTRRSLPRLRAMTDLIIALAATTGMRR